MFERCTAASHVACYLRRIWLLRDSESLAQEFPGRAKSRSSHLDLSNHTAKAICQLKSDFPSLTLTLFLLFFDRKKLRFFVSPKSCNRIRKDPKILGTLNQLFLELDFKAIWMCFMCV